MKTREPIRRAPELGTTRIAALWIATTFAALLPQTTSAFQCVAYGPVSLVGTLVRQTYAGPPDYESVTKGDAPNVIWILQLDERTCVYSQRGDEREYGQQEMQLELAADRHESLVGKRLIVDGDLVRGGAKHEKRLVLRVRDMRVATALHDRKGSYTSSDCRCYPRSF